MSDVLVSGTPRKLLVDGRNPFADEVISADPAIIIAPADVDGQVFVSLAPDAVDGGTGSITVQPGSEDVNRLAGSDDITYSVPAPATALIVSLA